MTLTNQGAGVEHKANGFVRVPLVLLRDSVEFNFDFLHPVK
jgi:hypothetical protein